VVFDLHPALAPSGPLPSPSHDDPPDQPTASTGSWPTIQRQEAAGPADAPAPSSDQAPTAAITATAPTSSAAPVPAGTPAPAAASAPLDELVRQLFGPLTARLKAELRLDRERTGLLTDLRQ
jgi:hypothetical protein